MFAGRSVAILCSAAALAGPAAALAQSGSAGDNQYQDPFATQTTGGGSSGGGSSSGSRSSSSHSSGANGLSQTPSLGTSGTSSGTSPASGTSGTAAAPVAAGAQLPNTGSDPRLIVLAGLALLLFGIGLRLRTADEKF